MLFIEYYSINCVFNDLRNITGTAHEIAIVQSGTNSQSSQVPLVDNFCSHVLLIDLAGMLMSTLWLQQKIAFSFTKQEPEQWLINLSCKPEIKRGIQQTAAAAHDCNCVCQGSKTRRPLQFEVRRSGKGTTSSTKCAEILKTGKIQREHSGLIHLMRSLHPVDPAHSKRPRLAVRIRPTHLSPTTIQHTFF